MSSSGTKKIYKYISSDGEVFEVERSVAVQSLHMKRSVSKDVSLSSVITIPNVRSEILAKVVEFLKHHAEGAMEEQELKKFDAEFVKVDLETLYCLIKAADYLCIKSLLHLLCQTVADMIKGRSPIEIRRIFKIENDMTPEEEEELRQTQNWAFDGSDIYGSDYY